jgi:ABC-2 type transport system permease protein|tara:strand:- start:3797 stop:6094 length:2298 start_codon:yes stop_codon:yes gene_type:complete
MKSPFLALIKKDLKGYFDQPTGYILIVVFVSMLAWSFFQSALLIGEASLRPLFTVDFAIDKPSLPWLLALFIPAATMRLLSEEQRDGTLETLLTQPIRGWIVLLAKFTSGLLFVSIAIVATIGIPLSLTSAGDLDWGASISQYIGSIFLAGCLVSIGLFTSSLTRNQIVSFILGLTVSMALMIMGLEIVAITLPSTAANLLQLLSPITHFDNIGRGIIDFRDILYFLSLISTFLCGTFMVMRSRTLSHKTPQYRNLQLGVAGFIILSILIGWFGTSIKGRLDLTEDKIFTLSPATEEIVGQLDDLLTIDVYMSKDPPVQVSPVSRDINDFLDDVESSSDGMVKIARHFPEDDEKALKKADNAGIPPIQFNVRSQGELQIKTGYMGLALTYLDKREVVPFIQSVDGFEYRLASLVNKMLDDRSQKKIVAFLSGHQEMEISRELASFASVLNQQYQVITLATNEGIPIDLEDVDVLMITSPKSRIGETHRESIKNYITDGGKAFIAIEPVLVDFNQLAGIPNRDSSADFILSTFGISVESDLVFDLQSNETLAFGTGGAGNVYLPYPYWVKANVVDSKIGGEVSNVVMPWASTVGILDLPDSEYTVSPLISTTEFGSIDMNLRNLRPNSPTFSETTGDNFVLSDLGVALEHSNGSRMVITGDADWISETATRFNSNVLLGLNIIDWLAQEDNLASVRSKVVSERNLVFSSDRHRNIVQYSNIGGVPLVFIILGLARFMQRRSKGFRNRWSVGSNAKSESPQQNEVSD